MDARRGYRSHGSGLDWEGRLGALGAGAVIEDGVRIFHPENVRIGAGAYVGHGAHIDGYHAGSVTIGEECWIGAMAFLHGAGGIELGRRVALGPRATILTSGHDAGEPDVPTLDRPLFFARVVVEEAGYVGAGAIVLPGVRIGAGAIVGAGAVVVGEIPARTVAVGNPARVIRNR